MQDPLLIQQNEGEYEGMKSSGSCAKEYANTRSSESYYELKQLYPSTDGKTSSTADTFTSNEGDVNENRKMRLQDYFTPLLEEPYQGTYSNIKSHAKQDT
uniref:Zinc finger CCCH domain-containing protein 31 n=1 Tax=Lygus hesperus TaxID=30085 RepID=A0A0A9X9C3_LYGHE